MRPTDVKKSLRAIGTCMARILDNSAARVLEDAVAQVTASAGEPPREERHRMKRGSRWGYRIDRLNPLEFIQCTVNGYTVRVDLCCDFQWAGDANVPATKQNVEIRIWSLDEELSFRQDWDAERIKHEFKSSGRRVMLRYHFDLAAAGAPEPKYHVQAGGIGGSHELSWFPKAMDLPRLAYPPTDIVLACEIIAANFFPCEYKLIRSDGIWKDTVGNTQKWIVGQYFNECHGALCSEGSILDSLWNIVWS